MIKQTYCLKCLDYAPCEHIEADEHTDLYTKTTKKLTWTQARYALNILKRIRQDSNAHLNFRNSLDGAIAEQEAILEANQ